MKSLEKKIRKKGSGGARPSAGRSQKYGEPTSNVTIRVPTSRKEEVRELVRVYLEKFIVKQKS